MRSLFVVAALAAGLAACEKDVAVPCAGEQCHGKQATSWYEANPVLEVELLFIVDPALVSAEEERFRQMVRAFRTYRSLDLRVSVMPIGAPGDRWLIGGEACGLAGAESADVPLTCGLPTNIDRPIDEVALCLARASAPTAAPAESLETMRRALLAPRPSVSARAALWVVIVAGSDDSSAAPVADYLAFLSALQEQRRPGVLLSIVAPAAAPRLEAVLAGVEESILARTDGDWTRVTGAYQRFFFRLPNTCLPDGLLDTQPAEPGLQPECVVSEWVSGGAGADAGAERVVPRCGSGAVPCHWLRNAPECASALVALEVDRGGCAPVPGTVVEVTCAVTR
jgi:hypothetical protein